MLKTRLIMTLLIEDNQLVKGLMFDKSRKVDTIIPTLKVYEKREVDELVIYDTKATSRGEINYSLISEISRYVSIPLAYGGGIKSASDIRKVLMSGADKVVLNSVLYSNPDLIKEAAIEFGAQCVIVGIDYKTIESSHYCYSNSGKIQQRKDFNYWFNLFVNYEPGEIIITSIDNDGMMNGYDLSLYSRLNSIRNIPIIASGGAGNLDDFVEVLRIPAISAVAASSVFHFTQMTPKIIKKHLLTKGIKVRL